MLPRERRLCGSLALALTGLVCGCSTLELEVGSPIVHQHVSAMMPGITRRGEAMGVLGTPQAVAPYGAGTVLLYEHLRLTESQFGVSLQEPVSWLHSRVGVLFKAVMGRGAAVRRDQAKKEAGCPSSGSPLRKDRTDVRATKPCGGVVPRSPPDPALRSP